MPNHLTYAEYKRQQRRRHLADLAFYVILFATFALAGLVLLVNRGGMI